jgi:hypothetical protein
MEFEPAEFVRKSFTVRAVEVKYDNIEDVAKWCNGRIDSETTRVVGGNEIKLPVIKVQGQGEDKGKELIARLGYFIVEQRKRFRVYKEPQFFAAFEEKIEDDDRITCDNPDCGPCRSGDEWKSNDHESDCDKQNDDAEECCGGHYLHNETETISA